MHTIIGKRSNFYDELSNCHEWFPRDRVLFRRPNHPKREHTGIVSTDTCLHAIIPNQFTCQSLMHTLTNAAGEKRMTAEEMRMILQSFLDNCSECL